MAWPRGSGKVFEREGKGGHQNGGLMVRCLEVLRMIDLAVKKIPFESFGLD